MFPLLRIAWPAVACRTGSPPTQQQPGHAHTHPPAPASRGPPPTGLAGRPLLPPQMPGQGGRVHSDPLFPMLKCGSQEPLDFPEGFHSSVSL